MIHATFVGKPQRMSPIASAAKITLLKPDCSREKTMLTLYHAPRSRSSRFIWLLEEIGAPYRIEYVSIRRGDGTGGPDARNPHPHKQVPALVHDDALITESAAIALYLSDAFPRALLGPQVGHPLRGAYLTWLAYYAGVMEPSISAKFEGKLQGNPKLHASYDAMVERVRKALDNGPYMLGEMFSTADVLVVSALQFARTAFPEDAIYDQYLSRLQSRPAVQRAMAKDAA
jgi:glutathione S-transferase